MTGCIVIERPKQLEYRKTHSHGLPVVETPLDVHLALGTQNKYGYRKYNIFSRDHHKPKLAFGTKYASCTMSSFCCNDQKNFFLINRPENSKIVGKGTRHTPAQIFLRKLWPGCFIPAAGSKEKHPFSWPPL